MPEVFDYCAERVRLDLVEASFNTPEKSVALLDLGTKFAKCQLGWKLAVQVRDGEERTLLKSGSARTDANGEFCVPLPPFTAAFCLSVRLCKEIVRCCKSCSKCCAQRADQCLDVKRCVDGQSCPCLTLPKECCLCKKQKLSLRYKADLVASP